MNEFDAYEFERFVADLWEEKGYDVEMRPGSGDRGIDFEAEKLGRKEVVQVKNYAPGNKVGSQEVRNYATLYQQVPDANTVVIVTSSSFTPQAQRLADDLKVEIYDGNRLSEEIDQYGSDFDVNASPVSTDSDTRGIVDFFNSVGGYGFIATEDTEDDVFFHMEDIDGDDLEEGQKVGIDIEHASKGPRAKNVVRLNNSVSIDAESNRDHSACFIATAAYGTKTAEEIDVLRSFRDKKLRGTSAGELVISGYYSMSPPIAKFLMEGRRRQFVVRKLFVKPLVFVVHLISKW